MYFLTCNRNLNINGTYCIFSSKTFTLTRRTGYFNEVFVLNFYYYYSLLIRIAANDLFTSCTMDTVQMLALLYV